MIARNRSLTLTLGVLLLGLAVGFAEDEGDNEDPFALSSPALAAGEPIPVRHTCDAEDLSPPLAWANPPEDAESFALIVDDPDAPTPEPFVHWVAYNLPADLGGLPEGVPPAETLEQGGLQGRNDFGRLGYGGPCPPPGDPHRYQFKLFALDAAPALEAGAGKGALLEAMDGHVLAQVQLEGTYQR